MEHRAYKVGDLVEWCSSNTKKVGVVTHALRPGEDPLKVEPRLKNPGSPRDHQTYILRGRRVDSRGQILGGKAVYWPVVSLLKPLTDARLVSQIEKLGAKAFA